MKIPLAYNLRNLVVRKTTTLMTAAGIALTLAVLVSSLALVNGLRVNRKGARRTQMLSLGL
jgi:putative ABC transport system permease protein